MFRAKRVVKLEDGNKFVKWRRQKKSTQSQNKFNNLCRENENRSVEHKTLRSEGKNNSGGRNKNQSDQNSSYGKFNREFKNHGLKNPENKQKRTIGEKIRGNNKNILHVNESGNPNSCLVYFGKDRVRALVDTGADICVMSEKIYKKSSVRRKLKPVSQTLQGAGGKFLHTLGITEVTFRLGSRHYTQKFYVVRKASRNLILGLDFLRKNNARIYLDLEKIRLNEEYVDLDMDIQIGSVVRLSHDVILPPQSRVTVEGKVGSKLYYQPGQVCEFKQDEKAWLSEQPGLVVANSISVLDKHLQCKMLIVNSTNRCYSLKQDCVLGKVSKVQEADVCSLNEVTKQEPKGLPTEPDFSEAVVPEHLRKYLLPLLKKKQKRFCEK